VVAAAPFATGRDVHRRGAAARARAHTFTCCCGDTVARPRPRHAPVRPRSSCDHYTRLLRDRQGFPNPSRRGTAELLPVLARQTWVRPVQPVPSRSGQQSQLALRASPVALRMQTQPPHLPCAGAWCRLRTEGGACFFLEGSTHHLGCVLAIPTLANTFRPGTPGP